MEIMFFIVFMSLAVGLVLLNVYASFIVWYSPLFEPQRKIFQIFFIWMIPALGAILAIRLIKERKDVRKSHFGYSKNSELEDDWDGRMGRRKHVETFEDVDGGD